MDRRESVLALIAFGVAAVSSRTHAQSQPVRRIGVLQPNADFAILDAAFRKRLAALGWVEGWRTQPPVRWCRGIPLRDG